MDRCPLCRATLGGADICRRCRADLTGPRALVRTSEKLAAAAVHRLAEGDVAAALGLAHRAMVLHATPENRLLVGWLNSRHLDTAEHPSSAGVSALATLPDEHGHDDGDQRPEWYGEE